MARLGRLRRLVAAGCISPEAFLVTGGAFVTPNPSGQGFVVRHGSSKVVLRRFTTEREARSHVKRLHTKHAKPIVAMLQRLKLVPKGTTVCE